MKKATLIAVLSLGFLTVLHSQISRTMKSATMTRPSPANQNVKSQLGQPNQVAKVRYVPLPSKIHFMRYTRVLGSTVRTMNTMDHKTDIQTTRQLSSTTMRNTSVEMRNRQASGTSSQFINQAKTMVPESYSKTRTINGHKVTYFLTSDIAGWPSEPLIKPSILKTSPNQPDKDNQWNCHTTTVSLDARSKTFMNAHPEQQGSALLPGMIYSFDDFFSGNFNQKYNFNRAPITLVSDVLNSRYPLSAEVNEPNMATIAGGISSIINQYAPSQAHGYDKIQTLLTNNQSDEDIIVTTGGAYGGFSGTNTFHHTENDHHFYFTIDAVKTLYTINVQPGQNGYYTNGNIPASGSPLLMIQSVSYGARVLANMDVEIKSTSNINGLQLKYEDIGENANVDLNTLFANNSVNVTINGYLIGFPAKFQGNFSATKDNFFGMLNQFFSGCDYQSAAPIEYNFVNMSGDAMGIASATDQFTVPECTPADETFTLQQPVLLTVQTGSDNKNSESEFDLFVTGNRTDGGKGALGIFMNSSTEFKSNSSNQYQMDFTSALKDDPSHGNGFTLDDFSDGGKVDIKFSYGIAFGRTGDDWDVTHIHITLNFRSQKGTPKQIPIDIPGFRLSTGNGGPDWDTKTFWFNPDGTLKQ